jgi:hypothetical protein
VITTNLDDFDRTLAKFESEWIAQLFDWVMRALSLTAFPSIVLLTPRDTGRAQNGWDITVNSTSDFVPPEGAATYAAADVGKVTTALRSLKLGDSVFITNNVVYIKPLNDGHSSQAPAQFVESALRQAAAALRRAA